MTTDEEVRVVKHRVKPPAPGVVGSVSTQLSGYWETYMTL